MLEWAYPPLKITNIVHRARIQVNPNTLNRNPKIQKTNKHTYKQNKTNKQTKNSIDTSVFVVNNKTRLNINQQEIPFCC